MTGQRGQNDQINLTEILKHTKFQAPTTAWAFMFEWRTHKAHTLNSSLFGFVWLGFFLCLQKGKCRRVCFLYRNKDPCTHVQGSVSPGAAQ